MARLSSPSDAAPLSPRAGRVRASAVAQEIKESDLLLPDICSSILLPYCAPSPGKLDVDLSNHLLSLLIHPYRNLQVSKFRPGTTNEELETMHEHTLMSICTAFPDRGLPARITRWNVSPGIERFETFPDYFWYGGDEMQENADGTSTLTISLAKGIGATIGCNIPT